jgi:hypothetical protein
MGTCELDGATIAKLDIAQAEGQRLELRALPALANSGKRTAAAE